SRKTAIFCSPLMYSFVTSRAISMGERILTLVNHRLWSLVVFASIVACGAGGADGNTASAKNSRETKDNMSIAKSADSSTAARSAAALRTPVVLFFGTSLTAGYGLDPEQAFPSLIEKKAMNEGTPIKVINAGLSGETSAGAVRRIDWVLRAPADLVVVEVGANDALRGLAPDAARANLERVI